METVKRLLKIFPKAVVYDPRHVFDGLQAPIAHTVAELQQFRTRIRDPVAKKEALQSYREDKVKPLRFVCPLKGYRAYYHPLNALTVEVTEEWFGKEDYPIAVQCKYDGARCLLMKDGDKIIIRSDDGEDVTKRFPTICKIARKILPKTVTLDAEVELWVEGEHRPREEMAGYLHEKGPADDSNIVFNVFDVIYFDDPKYEHHELPGTIGDLHKRPYELRLRYLDLIDFGQSTVGIREPPGFNLAPTKIAKNPSELFKALKWAADGAASEGAVVKSLKSIYELDGLTDKWLKWKRMGEIHAIVWKTRETKTPGVYTLFLALRIPAGWKVPKKQIVEVKGKQYMHIGKTFNVKGRIPVGSVVSLIFHTLNYYIDEETGERYVHVYEPKFGGVRPQQKVPDSAEDAVKIARQLELLQVKRLSEVLLAGIRSFMDDKPHASVMQNHYRCILEVLIPEDVGPPGSPQFEEILNWLIETFADYEIEVYPSARKFLAYLPTSVDANRYLSAVQQRKLLATVKQHLGKSVHLDFRIADAAKTYLEGVTIMHERPGRIKEPVDSLADAKRIERNWDYYFKMTNKPQTYIASPRRKLWVEWKKPEPIEWLNVEGVVPPGKVGATKYEYGVFSIVDKPVVYVGTVKPDFVELFLYGKRFTGRWVIRLLPNPWREEMPRRRFVWLCWKPEDQMPYVLSRRAVQKNWLPPYGVSCLPPEIRQQIPKELQYWKVRDRQKAREVHKQLVELIHRGKLKIKPVEVIKRV